MYDCIDANDPRTRWEASDMLSYKTSLIGSYLGRCLQVAHSHAAALFTEASKETESDS